MSSILNSTNSQMSNFSFRNNQSLVLPISQSIRQQAQELTDLYDDSSLSDSGYLNTLAVLMVNYYCELMDIKTDLLNSESWNPVLRLGANISDLKLSKLGHLECRGVTNQATYCFIPQDVWENRIGYVIVEINPEYIEAKLLGFVKTVRTTELSLEELEPLENLLDHLSKLGQLETSSNSLIYLREWFDSIFQGGWQPLTSDFGLRLNWQPSLRNHLSSMEVIKGAKLIDFGFRLQQQTVILLVLITPETPEQFGVLVQLHPAMGETYLPSSLQLSLLEESGKSLKQVISRASDNFIQLPYFQGKLNEKFKISITLNGTSVAETFAF